MAYLGKDVVGIMSYSRAKDTMTGDGSTTTLTLSRDPGTQNNVEIYMDGVLQTPGVEYTLSGKVVTFTTAPETGLNVVALSGTETEILEPADNSVVASHLVGGLSLTDAKIAGLSSSKLSGALPALDGSALTNMPSGINVKSASDPAIDTNHANGVGTTWVNTTSGEMFVCTDATTDANVWTNVGEGSGDVTPAYWYGNTGIVQGGHNGSGYVTDISSWNITTLGNSSDWGFDNTQARRHSVSMSDSSRIVSIGGMQGWSTYYNTIDYITVASAANAQSFGNAIRSEAAFGGASDGVRGVSAGDYIPSGDIQYVTIQTPGNAIDFGANLVVAGYQFSGQSNGTRGVFCGGLRSGSSTKMDYVTIQTAGTCTEFGDVADYNSAACVGNTSDGTRGVIMDATDNSPHRHQYITIATLGNAQIFGNRGRLGYGGTSAGNGIRAVEMGGWVTGNTLVTHMDYVTIQTLGNSQTFGNLDRNCGTGWGSSGN